MAHLKRLAAPANWAVPRKTTKWIAKPRAGPHPLARSIPLTVAVQEYLQLTTTARESRRVIGAGSILVDNVARKDPNFPLSYMDVVAVPKIDAFYRVLVDTHGRIKLNPTTKDRIGWKLARVENKTTLKGGLTQLNLHDGRNLVVTKDKVHTGDTLKLEVPSQKVVEHYPLKQGHVALVIGGRHVGEVGVVDSVEVLKGPYENLVHLKNKETGEPFTTIKRYVFVVGATQSEINIPKWGEDGQTPSSTPVPKPALHREHAPAVPAPKVERPHKEPRAEKPHKPEGEHKEHAPKAERPHKEGAEHPPKKEHKESGEHKAPKKEGEHAPKKEHKEGATEHKPRTAAKPHAPEGAEASRKAKPSSEAKQEGEA